MSKPEIITPAKGHPYMQITSGRYHVRGSAAWRGGNGAISIVAAPGQRTNTVDLSEIPALITAITDMAERVAADVQTMEAPPAPAPAPAAGTPDVAAIVQAVMAAMQAQQA